MAYPYITQSDLEDRLSVAVVKQIFDDSNVGTASANPISRILKDASSKVAGYLRSTYDLDAVAASPPNEVIRLALDVAEAFAARRHPEYVRRDWKDLIAAAESELKLLRSGVTRLDVKLAPESAANEGGSVRSGDPLKPLSPAKSFANGTGDF